MSDNAKVLLVGAPGSGKTSILKRYVEDAFDEGEVSFSQEVVTQEVDAHGAKVPLELHHVTTVESISELSNVVGVVFVFDVTSQESFDAMAPFVEAMNTKLKPTLAAAMCCNKVEEDNTDERVVGFMDCKDVYSAQIPVFETSAKTGKNIKSVINNVKMMCGEDIPKPEGAGDTAATSSGSGGKKKKGGCALC
eukprot:TRINITY_DN1061_c1_g1_i1.p1 TRINITY_DN1061_c1_g1~~TRINITY_DN1061_c1_g1_i1.p1  ORF type:complete len:202 (-),score=101.04 TRINITY_DN1061_c1_g1_i1:452-1030(-)